MINIDRLRAAVDHLELLNIHYGTGPRASIRQVIPIELSTPSRLLCRCYTTRSVRTLRVDEIVEIISAKPRPGRGRRRPPLYRSLDDVEAAHRAALEGMGYRLDRWSSEVGEGVALQRITRAGRLLKDPVALLERGFAPGGSTGRRTLAWNVHGRPALSNHGAWWALDDAVDAFLRAAGGSKVEKP